MPNKNDRVQLPFYFDADEMLAELKNMELDSFEYYSVLPLRAPSHIIDTSLPIPPAVDDYADGSWTDWSNTKELEKSHYFTSVINTFQANTNVTLVRILRLAPNSTVDEHTDPTLGLEIEESVIRLTIPILNSDSVKFYLNSEAVSMKPGECWYLRLTDPHKVINGGNTERIN